MQAYNVTTYTLVVFHVTLKQCTFQFFRCCSVTLSIIFFTLYSVVYFMCLFLSFSCPCLLMQLFKLVSYRDSDAFLSFYTRMNWRSMLMNTFSYKFLLTTDRAVHQMSNSLLKMTLCSLHIRRWLLTARFVSVQLLYSVADMHAIIKSYLMSETPYCFVFVTFLF